MSVRFVAIAANIIGTLAKYEHVYASDGRTYPNRRAAIRAGFALRGSDDFNIGVLRDGRLVELAWMDEPMDEEPEVLAEIAGQLGFKP